MLTICIGAADIGAAARTVVVWATQHEDDGRVVCAANVHMAVLAHDDPCFRAVMNRADLADPDGMPVDWALRAIGVPPTRRVRAAPALVVQVLARCVVWAVRVGLYGGMLETLPATVSLLADALPRLEVACAWPPPFRPLTTGVDATQTEAIRAAGTQLLLVASAAQSRSAAWTPSATRCRASFAGREGLACGAVTGCRRRFRHR